MSRENLLCGNHEEPHQEGRKSGRMKLRARRRREFSLLIRLKEVSLVLSRYRVPERNDGRDEREREKVEEAKRERGFARVYSKERVFVDSLLFSVIIHGESI